MDELELAKVKCKQMKPLVYSETMCQVVEELMDKTGLVLQLNEKNLSKTVKVQEWQEFIKDFLEWLNRWGEMPFELIKGKKYYEELDLLMADLEDWIDDTNESLEKLDQNEIFFSYMEAWDMGIFF